MSTKNFEEENVRHDKGVGGNKIIMPESRWSNSNSTSNDTLTSIILGQEDIMIKHRNIIREMEENAIGNVSGKDQEMKLRREVQKLQYEN